MVIKANITGDVKPGMVCAPVHFPIAIAKTLTGISHNGTALLCAVRVEPIRKSRSARKRFQWFDGVQTSLTSQVSLDNNMVMVPFFLDVRLKTGGSI